MTSFAFVFPGQGSQSVGMLDAWGDHPAVVETLKEASDAMVNITFKLEETAGMTLGPRTPRKVATKRVKKGSKNRDVE